MKATVRQLVSCDQCEILSINGVACHETGCPNSRKTWDSKRQKWIRCFKCQQCGFDVEEGEVCDCQGEEFQFMMVADQEEA